MRQEERREEMSADEKERKMGKGNGKGEEGKIKSKRMEKRRGEQGRGVGICTIDPADGQRLEDGEE